MSATDLPIAQQPSKPQAAAPPQSTSTSPLSSDKVVLLELLKVRMNEVSIWVGHILQASAIFAALSVALFKFALDANATPGLRNVLTFVGIFASFAGFLGCILMERLRRSNLRDQKTLYLSLAVPIATNRSEVIKYATISAALAMSANLGAWVYVLITA